MSYGLIQGGRNFKNESMQGLSDVSKLEQQREMTNDSLESAKKQQEMTSMGTGAVILNLQAEIDLHDGKVKGKEITLEMIKGFPMAQRAVWKSLKGEQLTGKLAEWQKSFDDFRNDGANTGWFQLKDIDEQAAELGDLMEMNKTTIKGRYLKTKKMIGDFVENANSSVENSIRLSVYKSAVDAGISRKQAASLAKNLTVNFNRKGEIGAKMNAYFIFFNAAIQGTAALARAMTRLRINADGTKSLNRAQKIALVIAAASFGLAALNREAAGEDDDGENWWDKVPDHVKERNIVLLKSVLGGERDGSYWSFPLPYGYNIFNAAGTGIESGLNSKKGVMNASAFIARSIVGAFSPIGIAKSENIHSSIARTVTPTVARPITDFDSNENFFGSKIYAENIDFDVPKPQSHLSMRSTNDAWKWLAEALNDNTGGSDYRSGIIDISPDKMGYIFNHFMGGAGQFYSKVGMLGVKGARDQEIEAREIPFVRKFIGSVNWVENQQKFYERKKEIDQLNDEYESISEEKQMDKFLGKFEKKLELHEMAKVTAKELASIRKERSEILESEDLSEKQKDEQIKPIEMEMKSLVDQFNKNYALAHGQGPSS